MKTVEKRYLGIELGSTRIKAVIIDEKCNVLATESYNWENKYENGFWTYSQSEILYGIQECCEKTLDKYEYLYNETPNISSIGISAMMHGYIALDENNNLLVPFRTWRNTNTKKACQELTRLFSFNVPLRWSISFLYQSILDKEEHINEIKYLTTLSGYVHYLLTDSKYLGIGDASGMFPIDSSTKNYNQKDIELFNQLLKKNHINYEINDILPKILVAGKNAGYLTKKGANLLDRKHRIKENTPFCPPEGDAQTGMVATNSIKRKTGNISVGTSIFLMVVLDKPLENYYPEIDVVSTPDGYDAAMLHANNCTTDLNSWMFLMQDCLKAFNVDKSMSELYTTLFLKSKEADDDIGGLLNYNYCSAEPISNVDKGLPLFLKEKNNNISIANFMKAQIYSCIAPISFGIDIFDKEHVVIKDICGHGGFFSTPSISANAVSAILKSPITILENASEGGAWGIAILSSYLNRNESLEEYLDSVFKHINKNTYVADQKEIKSLDNYMTRYKDYLYIEQSVK